MGPAGAAAGAPRRVVLHVGAPKSGTTYLQNALWGNADALRADGFVCPGDKQRDMFHAAIEVREGYAFWGYPEEQLRGTWAAMCAQARKHRGTTIMSHELLGACTDEQAARALAELDGLEVHVVFTARDLVRQATSDWQERIKNGSSRRFRRFQRRVLRGAQQGNFSTGFWRNQDAVGVLDRWAGGLPPERVHVVVAPPTGADPRELWRRFGAACGFDGDRYDPELGGPRQNQTLGEAQVAVLRRVNKALDGRIPHPEYARVVKDQFAEKLLAAQTSTRPTCPPRLARRLRQVSLQRVQVVRERGYQVHGALEELVPAVPTDGRSPDKVPNGAVLDAFAEVTAELLVQRAEQRQRRLPAPSPDSPAAPLARRMARRLGLGSPD